MNLYFALPQLGNTLINILLWTAQFIEDNVLHSKTFIMGRFWFIFRGRK